MSRISSVVKKLNLDEEKGNYIGVKDTDVISIPNLIKVLDNQYIFNTIDKASYSGRAIDLDLINPITGRYMTGSSSGTALNVFLGINDIGFGTDGGGSVLAPALSLNLYGFISSLLDDYLQNIKVKKSTDGIEFTPSLGIISRELEDLKNVLKQLITLEDCSNKKIIFAKSHHDIHHSLDLEFETIDNFSYQSLDRALMMKELKEINFNEFILITCEGPIDLLGYGDTVMGHYDEITQNLQKLGHKYYLKVINMLNLSAFVVPTQNLSRGYLVICSSDSSSINQALNIVEKLKFERSTLEENYFRTGGK